MTVKILEGRELLRSEPIEFVVHLEWPEEANAALYFPEREYGNEATLIFQEHLTTDSGGWEIDSSPLVGWHMWPHADYYEEDLNFVHVKAIGSWVWFVKVNGIYDIPKEIAVDIVHALEKHLKKGR